MAHEEGRHEAVKLLLTFCTWNRLYQICTTFHIISMCFHSNINIDSSNQMTTVFIKLSGIILKRKIDLIKVQNY